MPVARIATPGHIEVFRTSQACAKLRGYPFLFSFTVRLAHIHVGPRFIIALNTAAKGKLGAPDPPHSPIITKLVALLDRLGETNPICLGPVAVSLPRIDPLGPTRRRWSRRRNTGGARFLPVRQPRIQDLARQAERAWECDDRRGVAAG